MIFLGVLALLQMVFLPGFLLLTACQFRENFLKTLLLSFGLSITINYFLILILTALHAYTRSALIGIYCIEFIILARTLSLKNLLTPIPFRLHPLSTLFSFSEQSILMTFSKFAGFFTILYLIYFYSFNDYTPKSVFSSWDAVLSWNPWAIEWLHNTLPNNTSDYPQLIPANVSIPYQLLGIQLQLFGKIFFYAFPFAIIGMLWDLGNRNKQAGFFWGIVFFAVLLVKIFDSLSVSGYADIPVATMCLFSLYLLMMENTVLKNSKKMIFLSIALTIGAASTKQAALLIVAAFPIFLYLFLSKKFPLYSTPKKVKMALLSLCVIVIFLMPWEIYKLFLYHHHIDYSNSIPLLMGAGDQVMRPTYFLKLKHAFHLLSHLINKDFLLFAVPILTLMSCYSAKNMRQMTLFLVLPMFFMWAFFFSYDIRNVAYLLPFLSIVLGMGFQFLLEKLSDNRFFYFLKNHGILAYALIAVVLTLGGLLKLNHHYNTQRLLNQQLQAMKLIGNPSINMVMYDYVNKAPLKGTVLTNYGPLCYLPPFISHCVYRPDLLALDAFLREIDDVKPTYIGLLQFIPQTDKIKEYLTNQPKKFELVNDRINYFNFYYIRGTHEKI